MKVFDNINKDGKCVICGKNTDGKTVLVPIDGTEADHNVECEQVHLDCLSLRMKISDNFTIIYQMLEDTK